MAKLTKIQKQDLEYIKRNLERGINYLNQPNVIITRKCDMATTTLHCEDKQGNILYPVNKEYGSDLTGVHAALERLNVFFSENY